jgi:hypothetical protein
MTSVDNLFSNIGFLEDDNSINNNASIYENYDNYGFTSSPSLNQGEKYQNYQNKIKVNLEKDIDNVNSVEGFSGILDTLNVGKNGLTAQTTNIIQNNDFSPQKSSINNLNSNYGNTLKQYKTLRNEINVMTNDYLNRVNSTNPYLNKIVRFKTGQTAYVTNQGVLKYIPSTTVLNSINASKKFTEINMPWNTSWSVPGVTIPTKPQLLSGTPMKLNQSIGNEGTNIYVSNLTNKPKSSYVGCYADNGTAPLMQFVNGSPASNPNGGIYTYNMCQTAANDGGYKYFGLQNVNSLTSKGFCTVGNDKTKASSLGESFIPNNINLWNSNTNNYTGNTAILTNTGSLSVVDSTGKSIFSTPNSTATPSNYLGCYGDKSNSSTSRAMGRHDNGKHAYNLQSCQKAAVDGKKKYFGLQNSTSGKNAQCWLSNDLNQTTKYGKAGNCTKIKNGTWSGGGLSNAVYSVDPPTSNYYLILQDDGNMCIYRGMGPTDNQGLIWALNSKGKQQVANPAYAASKGKYGKNWISNGATMAAGDFVGSTKGDLALVMEKTGSLVLYTFKMTTNCSKMSDGNMGAGKGGNALYANETVTVPKNLSKVAYVDENATLYEYPSNNIGYSNNYTALAGTDSNGNDIKGASYANATVDSCKNTCNSNLKCAGFSFLNNTCYPKTSGMYPTGAKKVDAKSTLYVRNKKPIKPPMGASSLVNNVDTITYTNYTPGTKMNSQYGLTNVTSSKQKQLKSLETKLQALTGSLNSLTEKYDKGTDEADNQTNINVQNITRVEGFNDYLTTIKQNNDEIKKFDSDITENILKDSDIVVLQKNYSYLFWSILAVSTVLVSMNIVKKS